MLHVITYGPTKCSLVKMWSAGHIFAKQPTEVLQEWPSIGGIQQFQHPCRLHQLTLRCVQQAGHADLHGLLEAWRWHEVGLGRQGQQMTKFEGLLPGAFLILGGHCEVGGQQDLAPSNLRSCLTTKLRKREENQ